MSSPCVRRIEHVVIERVGDDVVLFDCGTMRYHQMHERVYAIWRNCTGARSVRDLALLDCGELTDDAVVFVERAIADLQDAELLETDGRAAARSMTRRKAGAVTGGALVALVTSITAPYATAALSCAGTWPSGQGCIAGDGPQCATCCCCAASPTNPGFCAYDVDACMNSGTHACI